MDLKIVKATELPPRLLPRLHDEQLDYANWLERWTSAGRIVLLLAFAAYLAGWLPSQAALDRLPQWWMEPLPRFIGLASWPVGWQWLHMPLRGEVPSLVGIALLASGPSVCLLGLVPIYLRRGDRIQAAMCVVVVVLLVVGASGALPSGR